LRRCALIPAPAADTPAFDPNPSPLVTGTFGELKRNPGVGPAEALRRAMLALIGRGGPAAHPANWAAFVVVGEGS
jgi:CHAT domain